MARGSENQALRQIRTLYASGTLGGQSDAQLVDRFLARGPEAEDAFAALVHRHGPIFLRVCRRMVPGSDADDAFQAVFLVLARRLASIRQDLARIVRMAAEVARIEGIVALQSVSVRE